MDKLKDEKQTDAIQNGSKNYLLATLGSTIGAFVATIPWILVYVYGNMIFSALAIIIAIGALKGYQIFKGTIDKKLPIIISIVSLLAVIVSTLLIIPILLIAKDGYAPNMYNFNLLYQNNEFSSAIIHDLIISIAFTVLGISGVVVNINKQIKNSKEPLNEIKISSALSDPEAIANKEQAINNAKEIFEKYNATDKEKAVDKNTILAEFEQLENGKNIFNTLKAQQIIRKYKGKYYFSENFEQNTKNRLGYSYGKLAIIFVIILIATFAIVYLSDDTSDNSVGNNLSNNISQSETNKTTYTLSDFDMKINLPINMIFATTSELDYIFGTGASEFYEFAMYNDYDLFSCFTQTVNQDDFDIYCESLHKTFEEDSKYEIISDYKNETISGFDFKTIEAQTTINDILFNDLCLIYHEDNKLLVFEYSYPSENAENSREVLAAIIQKIK